MCRCVGSSEQVHAGPEPYEERQAVGPPRLVLVLGEDNARRLLAFAHSENGGETHDKGRYAAPEHDLLQSRQPVREEAHHCRCQYNKSKKDEKTAGPPPASNAVEKVPE
ncbi:hypothetical protein CNMCM7927_008928 [Aspergillus lentulus]|nr:hypothetical protein CNMCM7927_008928 [Aspergillus lentulus]